MSTSTRPIWSEWKEGDAPPARLRMTEEEFVRWCDEDTKAEWVDGEVIVMAPANIEHDDLQWWLRTLLRLYVERKGLGAVMGPEVMVRFAKQRRRRVPDVLFVDTGRRDIIRKNHLEGAPDLIIEIVSPDSESRDWREKYNEYEAVGVREYWVIDPASQHTEVYGLGADQKYARIEEKEGKIASAVVPGWYLKPEWLFGEKRANVLDALAELGVRN